MVIKDFYLNIYQLLRIPHSNINYGTYYQVGIVATLMMLTTIIILLKKFDLKLFFFLVFAIISIFLTTSYSNPLWTHLPFIKYTLYPYRFLNVTIFSVAFLSAMLVEKTKLKTMAAVFLISITLYTNRHFLAIAPWFSIPPSPNLTTQNENDTIWLNEKTYGTRPIISAGESAKITNKRSTPYRINADLETSEQTTVIIRKMYFPGWQLKVNGNSEKINISDGLITTNLAPGNWHIETYFTETILRRFADYTTLLSFIFLAFILVKEHVSKQKAK